MLMVFQKVSVHSPGYARVFLLRQYPNVSLARFSNNLVFLKAYVVSPPFLLRCVDGTVFSVAMAAGRMAMGVRNWTQVIGSTWVRFITLFFYQILGASWASWEL